MQKILIKSVMTPFAKSINQDLPIEQAAQMMNEFNVRHIVALHKCRIVGVVSDRDCKLARALGSTLKVKDLMAEDPYVVEENENLSSVVEAMASHKYGCTIIKDGNEHPLGIFTVTDALKVLAKELRR